MLGRSLLLARKSNFVDAEQSISMGVIAVRNRPSLANVFHTGGVWPGWPPTKRD